MKELGHRALVTRLKRISDAMIHDGRRMYKDLGMDIEPNWFVIFRLLKKYERMGVMDMAERVGMSHPSVISIVNKMTKAGYLVEERSAQDNRKRYLTLTAKGREKLPEFERVWDAGSRGMKLMAEEIDLLGVLDVLESRVGDRGFRERTIAELKRDADIKIVGFNEKYAKDFGRLNYEWIEKNYVVEDHDREVLDNPKSHIIDKGGEIFFAVSGDEVLGTVAIIPMSENDLELAKMAVSPESRGLGISDKLMRVCIERAKQDGRDSIILESNTKQAAAIHLYRKFGFLEIALDPNSEFQRANIRMQLVI